MVTDFVNSKLEVGKLLLLCFPFYGEKDEYIDFCKVVCCVRSAVGTWYSEGFFVLGHSPRGSITVLCVMRILQSKAKLTF